MSAVPSLLGVPLKYISLVTLTLQNSLLTILLHYSRTNGATYSSALAVLVNELLKGSISFGVALHNTYQASSASGTGFPASSSNAYSKLGSSSPGHSRPNSRQGSVSLASGSLAGSDDDWRRKGMDLGVRIKYLRREIFSPDCWKLSIPAILYVIQNNLQFVAASNLDVATFQVSYQMKILTTALFSVIMLKRKLSSSKWISLLCLAIGVGIVQIQSSAAKPSASSTASSSSHQMDPTTGFLAVAMACLTSGLAGVYFEMVLKGSTTDLWIRNVQLSIFSLIPAVSPLLLGNLSLFSSAPSPSVLPTPIASGGFLLPGFGFWAWATVMCQVLGGLVTALVIKFSDNIMKGFATSLSIVISFMAGVVLFNFHMTTSFVIGCSVVLAATYAYNRTPSSTNTAALPSSTALNHFPNEKERSRTSRPGTPLGSVSQSVSYSIDTPDSATARRQYDSSSPGTSVHTLNQLTKASDDSPRNLKTRSYAGLSEQKSSNALNVETSPMIRTPSGGWAAAIIGATPADDAERGDLK